MRRTLLALSLLILAGPAWAAGREPFKLGTFFIDGEPRIGLVVRNDTLIVDLAAANRMLERSPAYPPVPMPATVRELVGRYEYGLKHRLYEIVADLGARRQFEGASRPGFVHEVNAVRTLAPLMLARRSSAALRCSSGVPPSFTWL